MNDDIPLRSLTAAGSPALIGLVSERAGVAERLPTEFPAARERRVELLILAGLRGAAALVLEETKTMPLQIEPITDPLFSKLIHEGHAAGRAEGQTADLLRLAERRFGPLPAAVHERIVAADPGSIEAWFDRAIDAPSPEAVFSSPVN